MKINSEDSGSLLPKYKNNIFLGNNGEIVDKVESKIIFAKNEKILKLIYPQTIKNYNIIFGNNIFSWCLI